MIGKLQLTRTLHVIYLLHSMLYSVTLWQYNYYISLFVELFHEFLINVRNKSEFKRIKFKTSYLLKPTRFSLIKLCRVCKYLEEFLKNFEIRLLRCSMQRRICKLPIDLRSSRVRNKSWHSRQRNGRCLSAMWDNSCLSCRCNFSNSNCIVGCASDVHREQFAFKSGCTLFTWRSRHFEQQNIFLQNRQTLSLGWSSFSNASRIDIPVIRWDPIIETIRCLLTNSYSLLGEISLISAIMNNNNVSR